MLDTLLDAILDCGSTAVTAAELYNNAASLAIASSSGNRTPAFVIAANSRA
jgi:hypothetical protein